MWQNFPAVMPFFIFGWPHFMTDFKRFLWILGWPVVITDVNCEPWYALAPCCSGEARSSWQWEAVIWERHQGREQTMTVYKSGETYAFVPNPPKPILPFLPHLLFYHVSTQVPWVVYILSAGLVSAGKYTQSLLGWMGAFKIWQWYLLSKDQLVVYVTISDKLAN